ncbi:MAG: glycoside hydrolase family 28 protein [Acidobacteriia bacterium]|nr:glycoside hydrolase family 28 protein [Terriglobia bacterium]
MFRREFVYGAALAGLGAGLPARSAQQKIVLPPIVYDVRAFGAVGDGARLDTAAIQGAVDACARAGGGIIFFSPGTYLSGTIFMRSHVGLHLSAGATLLGSTNLADYHPTTPAFQAYTAPYTDKYLIYGERLENIFIEGHGVLDGQGAAFERKPTGRPYLLRFSECRNVSVRDITLRNSGMWVQHYLACTGVQLQGLQVHSHANANNDGIDIDGCEQVCISDCLIDSGDDALVLKSAGNRVCRDVTITNCVLQSDCNAIKTGTESNGGFADIAISNCVIHNTRLAGLALEVVDGGTLDGVTVSNLTMRGVGAPIFIRLGNRARPISPGKANPGMGSLRNVSIRDVQCTGADRIGCAIAGLPGYPIHDLTLSNIHLAFAGGGRRADADRTVLENPEAYPEFNMFGALPAYALYCRHIAGLRLHNVQTSFQQIDERPGVICEDVNNLDVFDADLAQVSGGGPAIILRNVRQAMIHGCHLAASLEAYLRVTGQGSEGINLVANDLRRAKKPADLAADVPHDAVTVS